jgi:hypothetical protein
MPGATTGGEPVEPGKNGRMTGTHPRRGLSGRPATGTVTYRTGNRRTVPESV